MDNKAYLEKNKLAWNEKAKIHVHSEFYDQKAFLEGKNTLQEIELALLKNIEGKKILHLQCHFGQDTMSLARMGAQVTGIDLSDTAIDIATETARLLQLPTRFICCDVYDLSNYLDEKFDMVFTSYGTIGWLPDLKRWSEIVSRFLNPDGEFIFVEFHPVIWMLDNDLKEIKYNYLNDEAIFEIEDGTYADKSAPIKLETISWNHGLSEVIQNLLDQNLALLHFQEYDYSPFNVFANPVEIAPAKYRVKHLGNKIPMVYSLKMRKNSIVNY